MFSGSVHGRDILCTLGPASSSEDMLVEMMRAGMSMVRINTAHGTNQERAKMLDLVVAAGRICGMNVPVVLDIKGQDIRLGAFMGEYWMEEGQSFFLALPEYSDPKKNYFPCSHIRRLARLPKGAIVRIDSGCLTTSVVKADHKCIELKAENRWKLVAAKGISLPIDDLDSQNDKLVLSDRDIEALQLCREYAIPWIALSFVRNPDQVEGLRKWLQQRGFPPSKIMAKLETELALPIVENIIQVSDGIMIARGDLGANMPIERLPYLQKKILILAKKHQIPCTVATQMLTSMMYQPLPNRSEVTDVFNAILDGATGTMLSEESAMGEFVVEAVTMMRKLQIEALGFMQREGRVSV